MSALPRILLVEDEENFGAVLRNYLELSKFQVDWAVNGKLGYSKFRQQQYDLCVFDVMMPEKDGFELAKDVREINPTIPILFLTARGDKEDQVKGFKIGADDYITKPFDTELLLYKINGRLVSSLLQRRRVCLKAQGPIADSHLRNLNYLNSCANTKTK
jgi:two-component system OmpR family response regulator